MAQLKNIEGMTTADVNRELQNGGRFVMFQYCISILVMTFRRSSDVYLIKADESAMKYGWQFSLLTFVLGWWGIPWGQFIALARCTPT